MIRAGAVLRRTSAEFATQSNPERSRPASYKQAKERAWKRCGGCWSKSSGWSGPCCPGWSGYLLWLAFWVLAPVILMAILAVRAPSMRSAPRCVRAWVKRSSLKFGAGTWQRTRSPLFALGVMPIRVLGWLISTASGTSSSACSGRRAGTPGNAPGIAAGVAGRREGTAQLLLSQRLAKPSRPCGRKMTIRMKMTPSGIR